MPRQHSSCLPTPYDIEPRRVAPSQMAAWGQSRRSRGGLAASAFPSATAIAMPELLLAPLLPTPIRAQLRLASGQQRHRLDQDDQPQCVVRIIRTYRNLLRRSLLGHGPTVQTVLTGAPYPGAVLVPRRNSSRKDDQLPALQHIYCTILLFPHSWRRLS